VIILGLTGSIGMGKTAAAKVLRRLGVPVHDADAAVHHMLGDRGQAVEAVRAAFPGVVKGTAVDRDALASKVFADEDALRRLEALLHPLVRRRENRFLGLACRRGARLAVLDIPLLFETGAQVRCDAVIVVSAPRFVQELRVLKRPGMTRDRLAAIRRRQVTEEEKKRRADFVVCTGLGRDTALKSIHGIVKVTSQWRGAHWPPAGPRI
jgi:dephospho-CoA kinase